MFPLCLNWKSNTEHCVRNRAHNSGFQIVQILSNPDSTCQHRFLNFSDLSLSGQHSWMTLASPPPYPKLWTRWHPLSFQLSFSENTYLILQSLHTVVVRIPLSLKLLKKKNQKKALQK